MQPCSDVLCASVCWEHMSSLPPGGTWGHREAAALSVCLSWMAGPSTVYLPQKVRMQIRSKKP